MQSARNLEAIAKPAGTIRPPCDIAADIIKSIPKSGSAWIFGRPYLQAMAQLPSWASDYGADGARDIALRLLCNLGNWRGPEARKIKREIREAIGMEKAKKEAP
jgi:hypothetical protein